MAPRDERRPDRNAAGPGRPEFRSLIGYVLSTLVVAVVVQTLVVPYLPHATEMPYSDFKTKLASGQIEQVTLGTRIEGTAKPAASGATPSAPVAFFTIPPPAGDPVLLKELGAAHVTYRVATPPNPIGVFLVS